MPQAKSIAHSWRRRGIFTPFTGPPFETIVRLLPFRSALVTGLALR
jgi:hypothetical protein